MKKQLVLYILALVIAIAGVSFWAYQNSKPAPSDGKLILYYRDGCPHCVNVEKFMADNGVQEKLVNLQIKEGAINQDNSNEMLKYAKQCQIPLDLVGYPFLWTGSNCLLGDSDIINYFSE
jgi:glutaredoxin